MVQILPDDKTFEVTVNLDTAAFFILQGAIVQGFVGKYWSNAKIVLKVTREIWGINKDSLVNYKKYMATRRKLKEKIYHKYRSRVYK